MNHLTHTQAQTDQVATMTAGREEVLGKVFLNSFANTHSLTKTL